MERLADLGLDGGMLTGTARTLTLVAAVASAVVAGVFFAFSTFVMPALRRMPGTTGMPAMQSMNRMAPASPLFMLALMGTAALCVGLAIFVLVTRAGEPGTAWVVAGCALYLVCIVITGAYHVPRNDALNLVDPASAGAAETWRHYLAGWIPWNHVRTLSPLAATIAFVVALGA